MPEPYRRHIVTLPPQGKARTFVIDPMRATCRYVLPEGKAIGAGVSGEEALSWSGVAKVGRMEEWPGWVPTARALRPMAALPASPRPPDGRAPRSTSMGRRTRFYTSITRISRYLSASDSVRLHPPHDEDVIDLYTRVKVGAPVVVLRPKEGDPPFDPPVVLGRPESKSFRRPIR